MNEEDIKNWTKLHKNQIVEALLKRYSVEESKLAIFMAGIPGAGKTELATALRLRKLARIFTNESNDLP